MDNEEHPADTVLPIVAAKEAPKRSKKPVKLSPDSFLANWRDALSSEKDPVGRLRSLAKTGFQGEVNGDHISQLVTSLSGYPAVMERLAARLAVHEYFGKPNSLSRRLLADLRSAFKKGIEYDSGEFSGYRASRAIEGWITDHVPAAASEQDSWFRRFAVCVLEDSDPKNVVVGLVAASRWWTSSRGLKSGAGGAALVRGFALALSQPRINSGKIESILAGVAAIDEQFQKILNRELDLERQIRTYQDNLSHLNLRTSVLEKDLADAVSDGKDKAAQLIELNQSLTAAAERNTLLDRHWRGVSEQELAKQSGTFREKVNCEVVEALLALDREDPNLEIALRRLRRIQEILAK